MNELNAIYCELREALTPSGILGRIDLARCRELLDDAERCVPTVIRRADEVVRSESEILSRASEQAKALIREAEKRAASLVSDSAVARKARECADRIEADGRRLAADALNELASYLDNLTRRAKACAKDLSKPSGSSARYTAFRKLD